MKSFSSKTSFKSMIYLSKIITYENSGILVLHFFANLKKGQIKINTYVKSKEEKHIHTPLKVVKFENIVFFKAQTPFSCTTKD